jgi:glycosyltransferase involved in cell wall biosynthesis
MQSQCARDWLAARTPGRFVVIPNPVPHPPPSSAIPELRRSPSITAMGRLSHEKGFDLLIRAFAKVRGPHPDWTLTIFGEGVERKALEALRDSLGLGACVQLPGVVDKPHDVLRQSDLFVFPSRFEGFPNALCEAMACGLPVIAADCRSGPREIIKHGINGLLVAPGDHVQLAETIKQLIEDPPLRSRLGANAATLPEQFSLSSIMQQWDRVIYDSCSRGLCPDQPNPSRAQAA